MINIIPVTFHLEDWITALTSTMQLVTYQLYQALQPNIQIKLLPEDFAKRMPCMKNNVIGSQLQ
jgi:hypothetical protein